MRENTKREGKKGGEAGEGWRWKSESRRREGGRLVNIHPVFDVHVGAALDEFLHLLSVAAYRRALFH